MAFSQTLIEYGVVDFSLEKPFFSAGKIKNRIKDLVAQCKSEPIELRGDAPLAFALPLFVELSKKATAITYRPAGSKKAFLLYSFLDPELFFQPYDVFLVDGNQNIQEHKTTLTAPLETWWKEAQMANTQDPLNAFCDVLYKHLPKKDKVVLQETSLLPAFFAVQWFLQAHSLYIGTLRLI